MNRAYSSNKRDHPRKNPHPFPVYVLKRLERPTTIIHDDEVRRVDERDGGFYRSGRGDFGPFLQKEYSRFVTKHPLSHALRNMAAALGAPDMVDGPAAPKHAPGTDNAESNARHIIEAAYFLRADLAGICRLPKYAVFTHDKKEGKPVELNHDYAIAVLVDQDWRTAEAFTGNDWISNSMSFMSYSASAFIACNLADYIRKLGYSARAHHAMNYQVVVPPILLWAGLGEMCRIGDIILNPFLGPRFKAAVVTTDMPLAADKPIDFGLQDFCAKCGKCAKACPSQAISFGGKIMHNGYERWPVDVEKCTGMRVGNQYGAGCGTCIKVCPWNKPDTWLHRTANRIIRNVPPSRRLFIWMDDLFKYGRPRPEWKWWLDLEDKAGDGVLEEAPHPKEK